MAYSERLYKGVYKELVNDKALDIQEVSFYEGCYADLYEHLLANGTYDIEFYINQAKMTGRKVFEIACGSGRVGIPLAKAGFDVTGVDISDDMISLYRKKLEKESIKVRKKIHLIQGDITKLQLSEKFDLIILPCTTICLFSDNDIRTIFEFVAEHLTAGGRFIFDRAVVNYERFLDGFGLPFLQKWTDNENYHFAVMQEFVDKEEGEIIVNIYSEMVNGAKTNRYIGYTKKRIITEEIIKKQIRNSTLKLYRTVSKIDDDNCGVEFYILVIR